jgi:Spy/CpxP family protein refolding chaperone
MRTSSLAAAALLAAAGAAWAAGAAAQSAPATVDSVREAARTDKRGLVERNMKLTPEEAKVFWPIYDDYQKQLDRIVKRENRAITDFVASENSMTDANAKRIVNEVLGADADEQKLRDRQMRKLTAALNAKKAARFIQIENKIRTIQRYDIVEQLPLVR